MIEMLKLAEALEAERLTSLLSLGILDTPPQREFDGVAALAAMVCRTDSAAVTLIGSNRAWFKAKVCVEAPEVPRAHAFCSIEINQAQMLQIPDTWLDSRCIGNPLAQGPDAVRFYAGAPLISASGHCIGRLCVLDRAPRKGLTREQSLALGDLADIVMSLIEAHRVRQIGRIATQVVDVTSDAILCADASGRITFWNAAAESMFSRPARDAVGQSLDIIMPESLREAHNAGFFRAASGSPMTLAGKAVELTAIKRDGTEFPVELSLARWHDGNDQAAFAAIIRDITDRKTLESQREDARMFLDTIIENLPAMLFVKDADTQRYLLMNKAGAEIAGRPKSEFAGRTDSELFPGQGEAYESRDRAACQSPGVHIFESKHVRHDGEIRSLRTKRLVVEEARGHSRYLVGMTEDVTEVRAAQAEVQRLGIYDHLTGLRNRESYVRQVDQLTQHTRPFSLLAVDLLRFKAVNDQFGHHVGDAILMRFASRLSECCSAGDLIFRLGGNEFAVVLTGEALERRTAAIAAAIAAGTDTPFENERYRVHLGISVGISIFPEDGRSAVAVRQGADLALRRAKHKGRGSICFYSESMDRAARDRQLLEASLRDAIEADDIELAFQPVVAADSRQITSFEALARWAHPSRGQISPADFISLAEECGLIEVLGARLLKKACTTAVRWPNHIRVAVNLSPLQFSSGKLCEIVQEVIKDTGLTPDRLQLEVTEGLLIQNVDSTFKQLNQLRSLGIQILMDDFGVGYSSLSYFERFPFDKVKLDKSFVDKVSSSPSSQAIIKAVVQLGSTLKMGVVAEGVETIDQMKLLQEYGCTHLQGYLLGKPMPASDVPSLLSNVA